MMLLDGLESEEFDHLVEQFIDREDPNAMSFEALDQAARLQLAEVASAQAASRDYLCWPNNTSVLESAVADVLFQPGQGAHVCTCRKSVLYCGRC
jgi:hypothetical protein